MRTFTEVRTFEQKLTPEQKGGMMAGAQLNERSILESLQGIVDSLQQGNLEGARAILGALDFERLLTPIPDPTKDPGHRLFIDSAGVFGVERVYWVGKHLRKCRVAMDRSNGKRALDAAQKGLARWQDG